MLDKTFDPAAVEPRLYNMWEKSGAFAPSDAGEAFSIVIPPPNVTGSLHIGHALNNTLQDVLARFERMRGKAVLWLPGTDHAGIATQMVVERQLAASGDNIGRREMGRDAFVEKVWEWKAESGGTIVRQLRRLGASCDWSREKFTLDRNDDGPMSKAVRKVFVTLHQQGLMYRDKRLVNWDPHFQTAISDLEVEQREVEGAYYHFAYPLADGLTYQHPVTDEDGNESFETRDFIVVATTRPETMLGDTAVAVHPDDERYKGLIGKLVDLPIVGRRIPIVADEYADPSKGSGAVKITPAHDFNDFQVGKRHALEAINILKPDATLLGEAVKHEGPTIGPDGSVTVSVGLGTIRPDGEGGLKQDEAPPFPQAYWGLHYKSARSAIVAEMERLELLKRVEKTRHMVPHGDRSGVEIQPFLTDQWYVNAKELAKEAIKAVEDGRTVFEPRSWEKTYFEWMRNIEPWCVSRQLWWGHRIPVWYGTPREGDTGLQPFVAETEAEALAQAQQYYGKPVKVAPSQIRALMAVAIGESRDFEYLWQDEDVLDTWFSSALWPFSTMRWPDIEHPDFKRFYPTNTLITGFDIIFFWVARMMMMGLHFTGEAPFKRVFINALVRDDKGQKMSKSKGNVMDPLVLIDAYGADALRFTMTAMSGQGRDIKLSEQRIEGYRNFGTKLWNATRFCQMNECARIDGFDPASVKLTLSRWIRGEVHKAHAAVTAALEACAFDDAANTLYRFIWNVFCDWYLELAKPILNGDDQATKDEIRAVTAWVLDQATILLHPVMPFMTEELWQETGGKGMLIKASWPKFDASAIDAEADEEINWLIDMIGEIRSIRSEMNVPGSARVPLSLLGASDATRVRLGTHEDLILFLGRVSEVKVADSAPAGSVPFVAGEATAHLAIAEFIDVKAEAARLSKGIADFDKTIDGTARKLGNPDFVAKAPEEVIEENRERLQDAQDGKAKLSVALERLKAVL